MLKWTSRLDEQLYLIDIFKSDSSSELTRATRLMPLTICACVKTILSGEPASRVSQTLEYKNWPLCMRVNKILSRKRKKNEDWGVEVDVSVDIRHSIWYGKSWKITTPEQLFAAFEELYGTRELNEETTIIN